MERELKRELQQAGMTGFCKSCFAPRFGLTPLCACGGEVKFFLPRPERERLKRILERKAIKGGWGLFAVTPENSGLSERIIGAVYGASYNLDQRNKQPGNKENWSNKADYSQAGFARVFDILARKNENRLQAVKDRLNIERKRIEIFGKVRVISFERGKYQTIDDLLAHCGALASYRQAKIEQADKEEKTVCLVCRNYTLPNGKPCRVCGSYSFGIVSRSITLRAEFVADLLLAEHKPKWERLALIIDLTAKRLSRIDNKLAQALKGALLADYNGQWWEFWRATAYGKHLRRNLLKVRSVVKEVNENLLLAGN